MAIDHVNRTMSLGEVESLLSINYGQTSADVAAAADPSSRVLVAPNTLPGSAIVDDTGAIIAMANISTDSTVTATPAWMLDRVVDELLHDGQASHAWLGILVEPAGDASSVVVTAVIDDSPCDHAKLKGGDIIDAVDGEPLSTTMSLWTMVQRRAPGETVDLAITRNGQRRLVQVTLGDSSWARD
jgi:S1-C subfamily serine protease